MSNPEATATEKPVETKSLKDKFKDAGRRVYKGISSFLAAATGTPYPPLTKEQIAAAKQAEEEKYAADKLAAEEAAKKAAQERLDAAYTLGATGPQGYIATAAKEYRALPEKIALLKGCASVYAEGRTFPLDTFALFHPSYKDVTEENPMFKAGYKGSVETIRMLAKIDTLDIADKVALIVGCAKARKEKRPENMAAFADECKNVNTVTLAQAGAEGSREVLEAIVQYGMALGKIDMVAASCVKAVSDRKYEQLQNFLSVYVESASKKAAVISGEGRKTRLSDAYRNNVIQYVYPLIEESLGPTSSMGLWSQKMTPEQKKIYATAILLNACEKGHGKIVEATLLHKADGMVGNGMVFRLANGNREVLKGLHDGGLDLVAAATAQGYPEKFVKNEYVSVFEKENLTAQVELYKKQAREMTLKYVELKREMDKLQKPEETPAATAPADKKPEAPAAPGA
jgi:hypothetical protein